MERVDIFSKVDMDHVHAIAIITLPDENRMTLFMKTPDGFMKMVCMKTAQDDTEKTCIYCEETSWSKSSDTCYLYRSYGDGYIGFVSSYKDEDEMFDSINQIDPIRYTFSSIEDLYSKVKDENDYFYFTLDTYKYCKCPSCLFKEESNSFDMYTLDEIREIANCLFYDDCEVAVVFNDDSVYHIIQTDSGNIVGTMFKKKELKQAYITD